MSVDDRFRRQLAVELEHWVAAATIEPQQRDRLREQYQLDRLDLDASNRFTAILLTVGAVLIGLGGISFVAANWAAIPPGVRALGVIVLMCGFDISGYCLWRSRSARWQRLGSALLAIGQLMLGASIGLMAQWLQISGSPSGLFLWWGIGVLAMAYGVRHTFSGALAIVLMLAATVSGMEDWPFGSHIDFAIQWMPLAIPAVCLPLAYWCRSRWIFAFAILATCFAFVSVALHTSGPANSYWFLLGSFAIAASLWSGSFCHQRAQPQLQAQLSAVEAEDARAESLNFAPIAQFFSLLGWLSYLYVLGFAGVLYGWRSNGWQLYRLSEVFQTPNAGLLGTFVAVYGGLAIAAWVANWRHRRTLPRPVLVLDGAILSVAASMAIFLQLGHLWGLSLVAINLLYFGLAGILTWHGLQLGIRWRYWMGLLALTLQLISRFFEYDTGLLVKSLVLVAAGIGIVLAGLSFERHARDLRSSPSLPQNP